jgi:hypothetical protein
MASSSENQGLQIAVIIFALLTIIMSGATFYVFKLSEDAELRAAEATKKSTDATKALNDALAEMDEYRKMQGTKYAAMAQPKLEEVKTLFAADMAAYAPTMPQEKQAYADALEDLKTSHDKMIQELAGEREKVKQQALDVAASTQRKDEAIETHSKAAAAAQDEKKAAEIKQAEDRRNLTNTSTELAKRIQEVQAEADAQIGAAKQANTKLTQQVGALENLNLDKQKKLDDLSKRTFVAADGEIRWVSPQTKTVWINLGRDDGLRKSVTFSVYGLDQNGVARSDPKGSIEVTQILGSHLAEARILEDNLSDPILIRDQLYTPLWHPGRQELFAICGMIDVDKDKVSDVGFIKDMIRRNGGDWVAELMSDGTIKEQGDGMTTNTRYLIKGEQFPNDTKDSYGKMLDAAKELGVEVLSLEKFLDYVGWKDTSKVVNFGRDSKAEDFLYDPNQNRANRQPPSVGGASNFRRRAPLKATNGNSAY